MLKFDRFYNFSIKFVQIFSLLLFALLSFASLTMTAYVSTNYEAIVRLKKDNVLANLVFLVLAVFVLYLVARVLERAGKRGEVLLGIIVCSWVFLFCILWIRYAWRAPHGDQRFVYVVAAMAAANDFSGILEGGYLSIYPFQVGIIGFYELVARIAGAATTTPNQLDPANIRVFQLANVPFLVAIVFCGWQITRLLFQNRKITISYLCIMAFCFPLFFFVPFIYGEIPSMGTVMFSIWMLLLFFRSEEKGQRIVFGILSFTALILSVALRKNSVIFVTAYTIVFVYQMIKEKRYYLFFVMLAGLILSLSVLPGIQRWYEKRSGVELGEGIPSMTYFAMGMQESEMGPGWYNEFNASTYRAAGLDNKEATEMSKQAIRESLKKFADDPGYAFAFYRDKFLTIWTDEVFSCFRSNFFQSHQPAQFVTDVYYGEAHEKISDFMNRYQFMVYFGVFVSMAVLLCKKTVTSIIMYIIPITTIGGALFFMTWESNCRHVFPYFVMSIPFAAAGLIWCGDGVHGFLKKLISVKKSAVRSRE